MNAGPLIHRVERSPAYRREQPVMRILCRSRPRSRRGQLLMLGVMLVLIGIMVTAALIHSQTTGVAESQPAIDPGLILHPQTASLTAASGTVHARLQAVPLIPGTNHFTLNLDDHGRPIVGARITLSATMPGMQMQPIYYPADQISAGVYAARGPVTMFGRWRFDLRIQHPHVTPVDMTFTLLINVPFAAVRRGGT
jgi:hypothetical protein